eukprot:15453699-Alexandrium_andersonii.AAC.1
MQSSSTAQDLRSLVRRGVRSLPYCHKMVSCSCLRSHRRACSTKKVLSVSAILANRSKSRFSSTVEVRWKGFTSSAKLMPKRGPLNTPSPRHFLVDGCSCCKGAPHNRSQAEFQPRWLQSLRKLPRYDGDAVLTMAMRCSGNCQDMMAMRLGWEWKARW